MNSINLIQNKIDELKNLIKPTMLEIEKLENELDTLKESLEKQVLDDNAKTVQLFEENDAEFVFADLDASDDKFSVSEDDGTLHINIGKVHGCFICNQELKKSEWNKQAKEILKKLNIPFSKLNK